MVGARGFEPPDKRNSFKTESGHTRSQDGQLQSQDGRTQEDRKDRTCISRTDADTTPTDAGQPERITLASRKSAGDELPKDLALVVKAWDHLPEPIKAGIMAMVKSAGGKG